MKKLLALSLAALMVMGLSVNVFALYENTAIVKTITQKDTAVPATTALARVETISEYGFLEDEGMVNLNVTAGRYTSRSNTVAPGDTIYIPLISYGNTLVTNSDAVKSLSPKTSYILGRDSVESIRIVYKKYNGFAPGDVATGLTGPTSGYAYFVAITMKDSTSTAAKDVSVDITLKKTSGTIKESGSTMDLKTDLQFRVDVACAYAQMKDNTDQFQITSAFQVFDGKDYDGEQTFTFSKDPDSTFEVDVTGQNKILVKANVAYNATIAAKYPAANLDFFSGSGTFNRTGTLYLHATEGKYLYSLNADGTLSKMTASYDAGQEAFVIKTRTLGSYVISDRELDVTPPVTEAPSSEPQAPSSTSSKPAETGGVATPKPNPGTGVAA